MSLFIAFIISFKFSLFSQVKSKLFIVEHTYQFSEYIFEFELLLFVLVFESLVDVISHEFEILHVVFDIGFVQFIK